MHPKTSADVQAQYTLNDFLQGRPEELRQATQHPKILLTWLHGNEDLAPRVAQYLCTKRPDLLHHVDFICGNPQAVAHKEQKGFIETDLNRSFNPKGLPKTYEEKRAAYLLERIEKGGYEYVLDLHTSVSEVGCFIILEDRDPLPEAAQDLIACSPLTRVILMPALVAYNTLIGTVPHSIVMEYQEGLVQERGVKDVIFLLDGLIGHRGPLPATKREFFYVDGPILREHDPGLEARNFELCKDGYYPVLLGTGRFSYREDLTKPYVCFGAKRREVRLL